MMSYHSIPYRRNPLFIGRERLLAELHTVFAGAAPTVKIVEVIGMPGVGKTEIALEYAYRSLDIYQAVIWLSASSYHQLAERISTLLSTFGIRLAWRTDEERATVFEHFRRWLRQYSSHVLLILDHCDDYTLVNAVLDEDIIGHILITNDALDTADKLKTVVVKPFDKEEGSLFLLRRACLLALNQPLQSASRAIRQAAFAIHREFGGHPLALDQAGAYVSEMGIRVAEYLPLYRQDRHTFLSRRGTPSASHPFSAYTVIAAMRGRGAYEMEKLLALYVRSELDCSNPYPRLSPTLLRDVAPDQSTLIAMRYELIRYFLLVPLNRSTWDLHPLVRTVMLEVLDERKASEQQWQQEATIYEPLNEDGIVQLLTQVQQMKKRRAILTHNDPEKMKLAYAIATTVFRLKHAVLPGTPERRKAQKGKIEQRYADLTIGDDAPLSDAFEQDVRQYAQELLALMEYR